jgi:glycosyltransferase involved in cell wall biosynthesis
MSMKKVIIMYDFFSEHGGIERVMLFQAKTLIKHGFNVAFAFSYLDEKLKNERLKGFEVIEYGKLPIKNETLQICSSIFRNDIYNKFKDADLLICHSFPASYIALKIKRRFNIPLIINFHHPPQFLYTADLAWAKNSFKRMFSYTLGIFLGPPLKIFDNYCVKNADYYFVAGKTVQRIIEETYGIKGIILNPTVDSKFNIVKCSIKDLEKYNITGNFILGSGRIIKQKRFDYLINSFAKLKNKNLQLVIVGKYDLKEKKDLDSLASSLGINVNFLGAVDIEELKILYSLAKVTVLTCPKEWFGLVPVEAMTCGCPVVAWKDHFGPEDTVIHDKTGFLAEPYSSEDMARSIDKALEKKWDKRFIQNHAFKYSEKNQEKIFMKLINIIF